MVTQSQIDDVEQAMTGQIGAENTDTLFVLMGVRAPEDPSRNPVVSVRRIADLHDGLMEAAGHDVADSFLRVIGYPPDWWVPSCDA